MDQPDLTGLLRAWRPGDVQSEAELFPLIYPLLHTLARRELRRGSGRHTLSATDLLHEAYLRQSADWNLQVNDRCHFLAIAARVMRRVLVDHFRARHRDKRGADVVRVNLDELLGSQLDIADESAESWILVDDLLKVLTVSDAATAQIAELKIFSGLGNEEIAALAQCSVPTVLRRWRFARVWLAAQFERSGLPQ